MRVGREEAAKNRVVETGVHVDDAEAVIVLMAGEAAAEGKVAAILWLRPIGRTHPVAPRVEVAALHHLPVAIHNAVPAAQQVGLHIVEAVGIGGGVMYV